MAGSKKNKKKQSNQNKNSFKSKSAQKVDGKLIDFYLNDGEKYIEDIFLNLINDRPLEMFKFFIETEQIDRAKTLFGVKSKGTNDQKSIDKVFWNYDHGGVFERLKVIITGHNSKTEDFAFIFGKLKEFGVDFAVRNKVTGENLLHEAVRVLNIPAIEFLTKECSDLISQTDFNGLSPVGTLDNLEFLHKAKEVDSNLFRFHLMAPPFARAKKSMSLCKKSKELLEKEKKILEKYKVEERFKIANIRDYSNDTRYLDCLSDFFKPLLSGGVVDSSRLSAAAKKLKSLINDTPKQRQDHSSHSHEEIVEHYKKFSTMLFSLSGKNMSVADYCEFYKIAEKDFWEKDSKVLPVLRGLAALNLTLGQFQSTIDLMSKALLLKDVDEDHYLLLRDGLLDKKKVQPLAEDEIEHLEKVLSWLVQNGSNVLYNVCLMVSRGNSSIDKMDKVKKLLTRKQFEFVKKFYGVIAHIPGSEPNQELLNELFANVKPLFGENSEEYFKVTWTDTLNTKLQINNIKKSGKNAAWKVNELWKVKQYEIALDVALLSRNNELRQSALEAFKSDQEASNSPYARLVAILLYIIGGQVNEAVELSTKIDINAANLTHYGKKLAADVLYNLALNGSKEISFDKKESYLIKAKKLNPEISEYADKVLALLTDKQKLLKESQEKKEESSTKNIDIYSLDIEEALGLAEDNKISPSSLHEFFVDYKLKKLKEQSNNKLNITDGNGSAEKGVSWKIKDKIISIKDFQWNFTKVVHKKFGDIWCAVSEKLLSKLDSFMQMKIINTISKGFLESGTNQQGLKEVGDHFEVKMLGKGGDSRLLGKLYQNKIITDNNNNNPDGKKLILFEDKLSNHESVKNRIDSNGDAWKPIEVEVGAEEILLGNMDMGPIGL